MDKQTHNRITNQRVILPRKHDPSYPNAPKEMEVIRNGHNVSWEVYGKGIAIAKIGVSRGPSDGAPWISLDVEETKLAKDNHGAKRDVTKRAMVTIEGEAVYQLMEMLRDVLEPTV